MLPRWLSWLVLAFLGYVIVLGTYTHERPAVAPVPAPEAAAPTEIPDRPALREALDIEHWKRAINPDYAKHINCTLPALAKEGLQPIFMDEVVGTGSGAACGDTVNITLTVWDKNGNAAYHSQFELMLGARAIAAGIDNGLLGLQVKGVRTLVLPPAVLVRIKTPGTPTALLAALPTTRTAIVTVTRLPDSQ